MSTPWNRSEAVSQQSDGSKVSNETEVSKGANGSGTNGVNNLPQLTTPAVNLQIKSEHELQARPQQQQQTQQHVTLPSISSISGSGQSNMQPVHGGELSTGGLSGVNPVRGPLSIDGLSGSHVNGLAGQISSIQNAQHKIDGPVVTTEHNLHESYRPLNVKDALSYLEQVKFHFSSRPDVYNLFLDIMKDFKSQTIDTPGVIERVTTLFQGFPTLIQGFNTFLPHGYKIECSSNPNDPIKVTTPFSSTGEFLPGTSLNSAGSHQLGTGDMEISNTDTAQGIKISSPTEEQHLGSVASPQLPSVQVPNEPSYLQQQVQQQMVSPGGSAGAGIAQKAGEVEFSHAISYVNKIKSRFADQPDIYKQFLEILQTYQREQKPINEVYAQVTVLFQNDPDLLDDFKKFLPDASVSQRNLQDNIHGAPHELQYQHQMLHSQQYHASDQSRPQGQVYYPKSNVILQQPNLPPLGSFSASGQGTPGDQSQVMQSLRQPEQQLQQQSRVSTGFSQHIVTEGTTNQDIPISETRSTINGISRQTEQGIDAAVHPIASEAQYMDATIARPEIDLDPSLVPIIPEPVQPLEDVINLGEEVVFFDKVKRFIGNKQVYAEFLKILNLFSQDLLTTNELVEKVEYYLQGSKELFDWFKGFVGYEEKTKTIGNIVHEKHKLDLDLCEACGPSYKKLPKDDTFMPCSGRDEMCWEVLNDEWIGHPVWASEDSGFIAHRKNQYEETLFKIEEERHEYDFYIESNLRTIQTLETIANKIANMTEEEKSVFKLPPGLGHTSLTIYKKVIRKVYDKDRGFEIIDALHEYPAVTVPIVLKRLKQKDEEWRRAQREWNKVWRDLEQKVYYKSLDHLGLTFKQADKKLLTTKQLLSEISSIKVDQASKRIHPLTPKAKSQLDYDFKDKELFFDILELVFTFLSTSAYSTSDKTKLTKFFKAFVSLFFSVSREDIESAMQKRVTPVSDIDTQNEESAQKTHENSNNKKRPFLDEELFLRDILRKNKNSKTNDSDNTPDGCSDHSEENESELLAQEAAKPWLLGTVLDAANSSGVVENRQNFNLFANTTIYVFFRHFNTLYERLAEVKEINSEVTEEIGKRKVVQFASDLNLMSTQLSDMGLDFKDVDAYQELLRLSKNLIIGELEHQWFEESLRQAYKNRAFKIYTIDKVVQSLIKHTHSIVTDPKNIALMLLFENDRQRADTTAKDQILYRLKVRNAIGDSENMFRIEFNKATSHVSIQYVAIEDLTLKEPNNPKERWHYYLTSYALSHPTEGISQDEINSPYLEKVINKDLEDTEDDSNSKFSPQGLSKSALKINIHPDTYKLSFDSGSTDLFTRKSVNKFPSNKDTLASQRMGSFLESNLGWKKNISDEVVKNVEREWKSIKENGKLLDSLSTHSGTNTEDVGKPCHKTENPEVPEKH